MKAAVLIFIIILGYLLKRAGFFEKEDYRLISKVVVNITLPAAVINAFSNFDKDYKMLLLVLFGFICTFIPLMTVYFLSSNDKKVNRIFKMFNSCGFNIGCFGLPFIQAFFGSAAIVPVCMFDTGNAVIVTGGSYAITSTLLQTDTEEKTTIVSIVKKLLSSVPLDTYIIMFLFSFLNISIPEFVFDTAAVVSNANVFLSMFMIGLMLELNIKKEHVGTIAYVIITRLIFSTVFAVIIYHFGPFSYTIRKVVVLCLYTPIGTLSAIFTERCNGDGSLAGFTASLSILISLVVMTVVAVILKV